MKFDFQDYEGGRNNQFGKLGLWYVLALSTIATIIIIGQILIQNHLSDQLSDSRVVNVAGRQRMLSQKIVKLSLQLAGEKYSSSLLISELKETISLWSESHEGLKYGNKLLSLPGKNSSVVDSMFQSIQPRFDAIVQNAMQMIEIYQDSANAGQADLHSNMKIILKEEKPFLEGMDRIVNQYDKEAREKVSILSQMEYGLLFISLLVILLEVLFIFRPTARHVNKTMNKLIASEKNANKMAKEISAIYNSLEKSYEQLAKVNEPDEIPVVWAKADQGGNVEMISEHYKSMTKIRVKKNMRICDLFPGSGLEDDFMDDLVEDISELKNWNSQIQIKNKSANLWAEVTICPVLDGNNEIMEVMVVGTDISSRKQAEQDMYMKNRNEVEKQINRQKYRSVLILEGQEEERKRLAMDIHDGVGQLLTSLKFQIEGVNPVTETNTKKLDEIKQLLNDTIKEVRRITFNLKPTVLGDYGLAAGLRLFINLKLEFENPKNLQDRYSQRVENNVFRIVQEAINNAIKYANADVILVKMLKIDEELVVYVMDDGVGFDPTTMKDVGIESGSGFFNMYERTEYINGKLEIDSVPGKGTTVELHVPISKLVNT